MYCLQLVRQETPWNHVSQFKRQISLESLEDCCTQKPQTEDSQESSRLDKSLNRGFNPFRSRSLEGEGFDQRPLDQDPQNHTSNCHALISSILLFIFLAIFFPLLLLRLPLTMLTLKDSILKIGFSIFSHSLL